MILLFKGRKKALIDDVFAPILWLFAFGVITLIGYVLLYNFIAEFTATGYYVGEVKTAGDNFLSFYQMFDYIAVIMVVLFILGIGIASYRVASPPAFFLIMFVMAGFIGFVSYFFNYIFAQIVTQPALSVAYALFPRIILVCTNLHWVALALIIVGSVTMYAKKNQGQYV